MHTKENNKRPIEGKALEFIQWEHDREMERRKLLPPEEQKRLAEADKNMQDKMNS